MTREPLEGRLLAMNGMEQQTLQEQTCMRMRTCACRDTSVVCAALRGVHVFPIHVHLAFLMGACVHVVDRAYNAVQCMACGELTGMKSRCLIVDGARRRWACAISACESLQCRARRVAVCDASESRAERRPSASQWPRVRVVCR